jgi:hypothetical protein
MIRRTHVVLPDDLVEEVDRIAGRRKRSEFIEAAIREKLARAALAVALAEAAGVLDPADYPDWQTPEAVSAWVRAGRREDDAQLARRLGRGPD